MSTWDFYIGKKLGNGSYGIVYEATSKRKIYAVKILKNSQITLKDAKECKLLLSIRHPNIITAHTAGFLLQIGGSDSSHYVFSAQKSSLFAILMDKCETDLENKLLLRQPINTAWNKRIFVQILRGVEYLHGNDIIHRDLKPANILLTNNDTVQITDFGLAKGGFFTANHPHTHCGTPVYMAPEVRKMQDYSKSVDVYSLGVILLELYCRANDFRNWWENLGQQEIEYDTKIPTEHVLPKQLELLVEKMTQIPSGRPTVQEVLKVFEPRVQHVAVRQPYSLWRQLCNVL